MARGDKLGSLKITEDNRLLVQWPDGQLLWVDLKTGAMHMKGCVVEAYDEGFTVREAGAGDVTVRPAPQVVGAEQS